MRNLTNMFNRTATIALLAVFAFGLAACKKEDAPKAVAAPVAVPTNDDVNAWQAYASDVVKRNMDGVNNSPYVYFLPAENSADFQAQYDAQLDKVKTDVTRGIVEGNMLAFVSPASAKMADLVIAAFAEQKPNAMKGVKLLFIGQAADGDRVKAAVAPAGVNYVFVEAK